MSFILLHYINTFYTASWVIESISDTTSEAILFPTQKYAIVLLRWRRYIKKISKKENFLNIITVANIRYIQWHTSGHDQ